MPKQQYMIRVGGRHLFLVVGEDEEDVISQIEKNLPAEMLEGEWVSLDDHPDLQGKNFIFSCVTDPGPGLSLAKVVGKKDRGH